MGYIDTALIQCIDSHVFLFRKYYQFYIKLSTFLLHHIYHMNEPVERFNLSLLKDWRQHSSPILIYSGSFISLMVNADMYLRRLRKQWQNKHWLKKNNFCRRLDSSRFLRITESSVAQVCCDPPRHNGCVVGCAFYGNSKCSCWFKHPLAFFCIDRHHFQHFFCYYSKCVCGWVNHQMTMCLIFSTYDIEP